MEKEIVGIMVLVATIMNTIRLFSNNTDMASIFSLIGLLCFAFIGIMDSFFIT
jgi:hypothetical protein